MIPASIAIRKGRSLMTDASVSINEFVEVLASSEPAPGGGGAAGLCGAIGTALANMVGSLTVGKKKYADVEERIIELKAQCDALQKDFLAQIPADAEAFVPLSKAYGIPKDDPTRDTVLEEATITACGVPMKIMHLCADGIDITEEIAAKGSRLAVSDAGCAAAILGAAMKAASLNVFINTKSLKNREKAEAMNAEANGLLADYVAKADAIFTEVRDSFKA